MAEEQMTILVKAVDETSSTLKQIEQNTKQASNNLEKANTSLSGSFTKVQGAMLNLGQAAQQIHNIFEISQNRTRRLENAKDRLENATIRLKNATNDLERAQKRLAEIEEKHAKDSITLERAQIRLKEAQLRETEAVAKAQAFRDKLALGYKFSGEKLKEYEQALLDEKNAILDTQEASIDLSEAQKLGTKKAEELAEATQDLKDKQESLKISNNAVETATRNLNKTMGDAKWAYVDMAMQALTAAASIGTFLASISRVTWIIPIVAKLGSVFSGLWGIIAGGGTAVAGVLAAIPGWGWAILAVVGAVVALITIFGKWGEIWSWLKENVIMPFWTILQEIWKWILFAMIPAILAFRLTLQAMGHAWLWVKDNAIMPVWDIMKSVATWMKDTFGPIISGIIDKVKWIIDNAKKVGGIISSGYKTIAGKRDETLKATKVNDAIITKTGQVIKTNPNDTIMAMKKPEALMSSSSNNNTGYTIIIEGNNIYGTDPDEIASALYDKLRRKISL